MCEINPKHKRFYKLEAFTSHPNMTEEEFINLVSEKLLILEQQLNQDYRLRFHIHEEEE